MRETGPRVLLDACVLAAPTARRILFLAAEMGVFSPLWSDRIESEWRHASGKTTAMSKSLIDAEILAARAAHPTAVAQGWEELEGPLWLPDWNDRHVLAAAIAGKADLIVTDNIRDFPQRTLAGHGLQRETPDAFLWRMLAEQETAMRAALARFASETPNFSAPAALKRGRMPRFAKASREFLT